MMMYVLHFTSAYFIIRGNMRWLTTARGGRDSCWEPLGMICTDRYRYRTLSRILSDTILIWAVPETVEGWQVWDIHSIGISTVPDPY